MLKINRERRKKREKKAFWARENAGIVKLNK